MGPVQIRTDRLWLRPFAAADVDALHAIFTAPEVRQYLLDGQVMPRSWVEEVVARSEADFTVSAGLWCMAVAPEGAPVGFAGYREFHEPPVRELLYGLAPAYFGRGLATEASRAAIRHGFERLGMERIHATIDVPNESSLRLAKRLGLRELRRGPGPAFEQVHLALERTGFVPDPGRFELEPA
jgi:RimJ/RimL family protein N-acetyltransferase